MADGATLDHAPSTPVRRRRAGTWLLGILAGVLILLALGIAVLNSPIGHRFVADRIAKVAPASGLAIRIGRIDGSLYGQATLHDVVLSDPTGPFLQVPLVELDWRPLHWFTSGLDVRKLIARRGTLLRLPQLNPGDPDAPVLPNFDIRIDRFELDDLTVARGVAGPLPQRANLVARADIRDGKVYLKTQGRLGRSDTIYALFDVEPDRDRFDVAMDYNAPRGGALASLIGTKGDVRARIWGAGSWRKWDGQVYIQQGGERLAALRFWNRAGRYNILGQARPNGYLTGLPAAALGDRVAIGATGTLVNSVLDGKLRLWGRAVEGVAQGGIDLGNNAFQRLDVRARLTDSSLFDGVRLEDAGIAAVVDGPFHDLAVVHQLQVTRFIAGTTTLSEIAQQGTARFDGTRWTLPLSARVARVVTGNAMVDPRLVDGRLGGTLILQGTKLLADNLAIAFPGVSARLALRGDTARGAYALTGPVDARGLALKNLGVVDANANIALQLAPGVPWTIQAKLAGRMPRATNATLATLAGSNIRFRGGVTFGANRPLLFSKASLDASKLSLMLDGKLVDGRTTVAGRGRHVDYGPFTVQAALDDDGPTAELVFADPLPAAGLRDVRIALAPIEDGFRIDTKGQSLLGAFDGNLNLYAPAGGPVRVVISRLSVWETAVTGALTVGGSGVSGKLALAGGGLDGTIALAPRGGGQGSDVALTADNASFGGATPIAIGSATVDAQGLLVRGNSTITGTARAQGITYGRVFIGKLAAEAALNNGRGNVVARLSGRRGSSFDLAINAAVAPDRIAAVARGNYGAQTIAMPRRAVLLKDAAGWHLQPTQLSYGDGILIAEGDFGGRQGVGLNLKLSKMPLSLIDAAGGDLGLGGNVSGIVDYRTGGSGMPTGTAKVQVRGLTRSGLVLSSRPINLSLVGNLTADRLDTRALIREGGEVRGRLQGRIRDLPPSGGLAQRLNVGDLFAQLRYAGPADALWRLAAVDAFDLTGPLRVAADARGTLQNPSVRGSLASDDLRLRSGLSGTDVSKIRARGTFAGSRLQLTSFAGEAANGGKVNGSGAVDLAGLGRRGPQIDLRVAARNARLLDRDGLSATVTGPLRLVSNGVGGTIAGRVAIDRASWSLGRAEAIQKLPNIKTREVNLPRDIRAIRAPSAPWRYLIDAKGKDRIEVDGMGLDSEWGADILVRGTTDNPRIGGTATAVQGAYAFAGTRFEITRGRIDFDENQPIDPRLDIVAENDSRNLDVKVTVSGNATEPEIAFSSVPALPEEELLARLLFGGSISNLSTTDALQLGAALASLRGGGGMDPINQLRSAIGLDRLRLVSADPSIGRGTGVALGKNFGRRFYAEIITDGRGYSATSVEFRVTRWLSILGSISTIGRNGVSAEVSRDY